MEYHSLILQKKEVKGLRKTLNKSSLRLGRVAGFCVMGGRFGPKAAIISVWLKIGYLL